MENNPLWAELGKHWKLVALRGVAALVFGVLTLLSPALALTGPCWCCSGAPTRWWTERSP